MKIYTKILDRVCQAAGVASAAILGIMLAVSLVEIIRRYFFGLSFPWTDEVIRYGIVGVAALGGTAAYRAKGSVAFDLLQNIFHGVGRLVIEIIINTIILAFSAYILKNAIDTVLAPSIMNQISTGLGVSMAWFYIPIILGMIILILLSLERYYVVVFEYKNGDYKKHAKVHDEEGGEEEC